MSRSRSAVLTIVLLGAPDFVSAQGHDLAVQQQALRAIGEMAQLVCAGVPMEGTTKQLELSGEAKAGLNKVIRQLADIGVDGAVKYESKDYRGVLQEQLAGLVVSGQNCRLQVLISLRDKLLPDIPPAVPAPRPSGNDKRTGLQPNPVEPNAQGCTVLGSNIQDPITVSVGSRICDQTRRAIATVVEITSYSMTYENPGRGRTTCQQSETCAFGWEGTPHFSILVQHSPGNARQVQLSDAR